MKKNIQLRIDNPCSENWDHMRSEETGRFCSSCKKTVVDFTGMTDHQMLYWFTNRPENVCGRFHGDQLNRELLPQTNRKSPEGRFWRYLLAGLLISSEVRSQDKPPSPSVSLSDSTGIKNVLIGKLRGPQQEDLPGGNLPDSLRGHLIDGNNGSPIAFAIILVHGNHGYMSDVNGDFAIPRKEISDQHMVRISAIGYHTLIIDAAKIWLNDGGKIIPMTCTPELMGEIIIVGMVRPTRRKAQTILKDSLAYIGLVKKALTVYPNPVIRGASITLSLRLDEPGTYVAQLLSESGIPIEMMKIEGNKKSENVFMNIPTTLPAGTYVIRLSHTALKKAYAEQIVVL